jgi:hypothetical protein
MKKTSELFLIAFITILITACNPQKTTENSLPVTGKGYIQISTENPAYFQYSDGIPYIPIGINMVSPGGRYQNNADSGLMEFGLWMKKLSENNGNYMRIWLSQSFWDIEDQKAEEYREEKADRIDRFVKMAGEYNLKVKMTLEHFRSLTIEENNQWWAVKSVYHTSNGGPLKNNREYLSLPEGHRLFLEKVNFYSSRYRNDTLFFGWELWNEMNAMRGPQDSMFFSWNEKMLTEVKQRFPNNLVMQSLGSFDTEKVDPLYKKMMLLPGNEVAQVHRYLDLGAELETCHLPMDIICSSAVERLRTYNTGKPVILAETGAVEPGHSGPSKYYTADTAGILLHDILFAPFFSGAAGAGMSWHWDSYVDKNNLWYHFKRFSEAVKGINPIKEKFDVSKSETDNFRVYILDGEETTLIWLRDKNSSWQSELRDGQPPIEISDVQLDLEKAGIMEHSGKVSIYDPWKDKWEIGKAKNGKVLLPGFKRSLVVKITTR